LEHLNTKTAWNLTDFNSGIPLEQIPLLSERAASRLQRSNSPLLDTNLFEIHGAIAMMSGMDYHHSRYCEITSDILPYPSDSRLQHEALQHEAVAWINRVGQFSFFVKSKFVIARIGKTTNPNIDLVLAFRNKHTAHRSIDAPWHGDTVTLQAQHAMSLSGFGGVFGKPRDGVEQTIPSSGKTCYLGFQLNTGSDHLTLYIEELHPHLIQECYAIIDKLL
jgi:hypothetical protein